MNEFLRIFLTTYFIVYFGIAFVPKSVIVAKRIGKNPLVLPKDDSAYGLIGFYFKLTMIFMFVYVLPLYRHYTTNFYPFYNLTH